ncbi:MAG: glycosyltransferase family 4 protein [Sediminibacterium sp.]
MRILFLHSSSDLYGASKILLAINELCTKKGHEVTVVLSEDGPLVPQLKALGAHIIIADLGILRRQYLHPAGILNRLVANFKAYRLLTSLCKNQKIDLIYSNTTGVIVGVFVASKLGIRHLWHIHEIIEKPTLLFRLLSRLINTKNNQAIAVSEAVKTHWTKYVPPNKIDVLYNGVDYWLFENIQSDLRNTLNLQPDTILIGMMGRVHFWKGQDYFVHIAGALYKTHKNVHFLIVGDAFAGYEYLHDTINQLIVKHALQGRVTQLPYRSDINNIYGGLDVFILPSLLPDPAPAVVTEAMASGLPVVATQQGGAMEMIENNVSGLLIPINDAAAAAAIIEPLLSNQAYRKNMGAEAKKRMQEKFSRTQFNEQIMACIEKQQ